MFEPGYAIGPCREFIDNGEASEVTIVVGPHQLWEHTHEDGSKKTDIFVSCNMGVSCQNIRCRFSQAYRDKRRLEKMAEGPRERR